jgi:hypothetical protein
MIAADDGEEFKNCRGVFVSRNPIGSMERYRGFSDQSPRAGEGEPLVDIEVCEDSVRSIIAGKLTAPVKSSLVVERIFKSKAPAKGRPE